MLTWISAHQPLPDPATAMRSPNGLVAAGRDLSADRLFEAYRRGMFPWYSQGQPVLWWSPDPRMVVYVDAFEPRRSLRKTVRALRRSGRWDIAIDRQFRQVMRECAAPRDGQDGTWITPAIIEAYVELHRRGFAHSFEVSENGRLVAGLYGVSIGRMFFGESMFTRVADGSKCAYVVLIATLRALGIPMVDCQQSTSHLATLGGRDLARPAFLDQVRALVNQPRPDWSKVEPVWPDL